MPKHTSLKDFLKQFAGVKMPRKLKDVSLKNLMEYVGETILVDGKYRAVIDSIEINDKILFGVKKIKNGQTIKRKPHRLSILRSTKEKIKKPKKIKKKVVKEFIDYIPTIEFDFSESED